MRSRSRRRSRSRGRTWCSAGRRRWRSCAATSRRVSSYGMTSSNGGSPGWSRSRPPTGPREASFPGTEAPGLVHAPGSSADFGGVWTRLAASGGLADALASTSSTGFASHAQPLADSRPNFRSRVLASEQPDHRRLHEAGRERHHDVVAVLLQEAGRPAGATQALGYAAAHEEALAGRGGAVLEERLQVAGGDDAAAQVDLPVRRARQAVLRAAVDDDLAVLRP